MTTNLDAIEREICTSLCGSVHVTQRHGMIAVNLPMSARDGDGIVAYLKPDLGGWKISDMATTMMRLSYESDLNRILTGTRGNLYQSLLNESGLHDDDGELYILTDTKNLMRSLFMFGQGITRVYDLGLWSSSRTESSFYDDLKEALISIVGEENLVETYLAEVPNKEDYPIDFMVKTSTKRPLYIFGIGNKDKARLTTITLQHLAANKDNFDSMAICSNVSELPKKDINRLMFAANDIVPDMSDMTSIARKINHRLSIN
ncbi:DUF1828 domain-containing protein [Xenorhabdus miraniensis]|uniref:DUF1828 domain-containing protein n=1 Tax=Xenorhabdus miraniensis TaxID=351674 RepID=A0A2D0JJR7_9GAMM|nr:DUF1828 domain-containing protein [Xenorhabdus miraniensis]PHM46565.1 hypothetical protein Xmir_04130 [Xenorhabdus miraniensis]